MTEATPPAALRADKWLWQARFFKTRSLAARVVQSGALRINGERMSKPSGQVRVGDVLTFVQGARVRVVAVLAIGQRRGPATEAQQLYEDRSDPVPSRRPSAGERPTKKDRRAIDEMRRFHP